MFLVIWYSDVDEVFELVNLFDVGFGVLVWLSDFDEVWVVVVCM